MRMSLLPLVCLVSLWTAPVRAQVSIHLDIHLPVAPSLVEVEPGIQVVESFQEEVFFHRGWYWCRRPGGWYRARSPRARFEWVEVHRVPQALVRVPAGHYRNWHRGDPRHHEHRALPHERREDREFRHELKSERQQRKHEQQEDRRDDRKEHRRSEAQEPGRHGH